MKFFTLQIKVMFLATLLVTIPVFFAIGIFKYAEPVFKARSIVIGIKNLMLQMESLKNPSYEEIMAMELSEFQMLLEEENGEDNKQFTNEELQQIKQEKLAEALIKNDIKAMEAATLDDFFISNKKQIEHLNSGLAALERMANLFFTGAIIFIPLTMVIMWLYMNYSYSPIKKVLNLIRSFQNENDNSGSGDSIDMSACAPQFEAFLSTAKTLLLESHLIALELGRKLEPLTLIPIVSGKNSQQFLTDVKEISKSSNYISNTLKATTSNIQEVSSSAQTIAERSHEAATNSTETAAIVDEGKNAVSETIDTMESIKDEVVGLEDIIENLNSTGKQISEIVNTITNIAHQTNLLALNAAIEAARAGEHGQGFTVVAGEVRKLAEESGEAAEDIGKKIKEMLLKTGKAVEAINRGSSKVNEGVNIANIAGNNLDRIVNSVINVNKMIQDISNASTEQSQNIYSLRGSIESISGATKITSEGTKRVVDTVNDQSDRLVQYVNVTKELLTLVQLMGDMLDKFNLNKHDG